MTTSAAQGPSLAETVAELMSAASEDVRQIEAAANRQVADVAAQASAETDRTVAERLEVVLALRRQLAEQTEALADRYERLIDGLVDLAVQLAQAVNEGAQGRLGAAPARVRLTLSERRQISVTLSGEVDAGIDSSTLMIDARPQPAAAARAVVQAPPRTRRFWPPRVWRWRHRSGQDFAAPQVAEFQDGRQRPDRARAA